MSAIDRASANLINLAGSELSVKSQQKLVMPSPRRIKRIETVVRALCRVSEVSPETLATESPDEYEALVLFAVAAVDALDS